MEERRKTRWEERGKQEERGREVGRGTERQRRAIWGEFV